MEREKERNKKQKKYIREIPWIKALFTLATCGQAEMMWRDTNDWQKFHATRSMSAGHDVPRAILFTSEYFMQDLTNIGAWRMEVCWTRDVKHSTCAPGFFFKPRTGAWSSSFSKLATLNYKRKLNINTLEGWHGHLGREKLLKIQTRTLSRLNESIERGSESVNNCPHYLFSADRLYCR